MYPQTLDSCSLGVNNTEKEMENPMPMIAKDSKTFSPSYTAESVRRKNSIDNNWLRRTIQICNETDYLRKYAEAEGCADLLVGAFNRLDMVTPHWIGKELKAFIDRDIVVHAVLSAIHQYKGDVLPDWSDSSLVVSGLDDILKDPSSVVSDGVSWVNKTFAMPYADAFEIVRSRKETFSTSSQNAKAVTTGKRHKDIEALYTNALKSIDVDAFHNNQFYGVCLTGRVPGWTRNEIKQTLEGAGVNTYTYPNHSILTVIGRTQTKKAKVAQNMGYPVIASADFADFLNSL